MDSLAIVPLCKQHTAATFVALSVDESHDLHAVNEADRLSQEVH